MPAFEDLIGKPFQDGGRGPDAFDCWGLVLEVMRRFGTTLPDYKVSAFQCEEIARTIGAEAPAWNRHGPDGEIPVPAVVVMRCGSVDVWNHTGVYLGGGRFIHTRERIGACIDRMDSPAWRHRIDGFYTPRGEFTLVILRNPFRPGDREISKVPAGGQAVAQLLPTEKWGDLHFSLNGRVLDREEAAHIVPGAGDFVVACPVVGKGGGGGGGGGKNPLQILTTLALTVVAFGIGGLVSGVGWSSVGATAGWSMAGYLAAGAVLYLGGSLMSNTTQKAMVDAPSIAESSWENGYSWGEMKPLTRQGSAVALTYGTVRVSGFLVGQHVSSDGAHQFLNLLLCGGEGPLDSITDVKINGNPVNNFSGTTEDLQDQTLDLLLTTTAWQTATTSGTDVKALDIELSFPDGLRNGYQGTYVALEVQYRIVGETTWNNWLHNFYLNGCFGPGSKTYRIESLTPGQYEVQAKLLAYGSGSTATKWVRLSHSSTSTDVAVATRLGTNNQSAIGFFADSYADQFIQMELGADGWVQYQTEGNGGAGLEISFAFPQGLYHIKDDGAAEETWVEITAYYRKVGAVDWTSWLTATRIKASEQRPVRRSFRVDNIGAGQYEVRCAITNRQGSTTRYVNTCIWTQLTHIVYDDFVRPGKALVGIRAVATDKLSGGMPSISWLQTRSTVLVWNPGTSAYVSKPATNPAWVCYDLIHRCKLLRNVQTGLDEYTVFGEAASRIDYQAFSDWADFCNELVAGEKRSEVNLYIDSPSLLWDALQKVAQAGRGIVVLKGTQFSAVWDEASSPVQMFTVGNILQDSFRGEYLAMKDRATAVEVGFMNGGKDFQRDTVIVYGDGYDTDGTMNTPTQVFAPGITDYRRAYREGLYRLRLNKYLKRVISFQADVDAIGCQVGDVILIQHDVPRWGTGGRLVSATVNQVVIDKAVTLSPGTTYVVKVRFANDSIVERTVQVVLVETTTSTLPITVAFDTAPAQFDLYAFGETAKAVKPFRVTKISRAGDLRAKIEALEYYAEVYDETATVPEIDYSAALPTVQDLRLGFAFDLSGNGWLTMSWVPPRGSYGGALVMVDGRSVGKVGATVSDFRHQITADKTYAVAIMGIDALGRNLAQTTGSLTVTAMSIPTVTGLSIAEDSYILTDGTVLTDIVATFTPPDYRFTSHFAVYYELEGSGTWIPAGITTAAEYRIKALKGVEGQDIRVDVRVVNRWNVEGAPSLSSSLELVGKSAPPTAPTGFTAVQNEQNRAEILLSWSPILDADASHYEVRQGSTWETGTPIGTEIRETRMTWAPPANGAYVFWVKSFDRSGNECTTGARAECVILREPADVTGLTVTQDPQNKAQILLRWTAVTQLDVKRYEVRTGSSWATGTVVGDKIAEPFFTHSLASGGTYRYMVKAINRAGLYSLNEVVEVITVEVKPAAITGLTAVQDPQNRAILKISWTPSSEKDIKRYEVRFGGTTWETATVVGDKIADPFVDHALTANGTSSVRIKAINRAGFYSDEASTSVTVTLEPANVTGGQALQNGNSVLVYWTRVTDLDVIGYEIREGPTFDLGRLIATGVTDITYQVPVDTERTYTFWIKARNLGGRLSSSAAAAICVVANLLPTNIIESYDEMALQSGTHSNTEFRTSNYRWSNFPGSFDDYPGTQWDEIGAGSVLALTGTNLTGTYTCVQKDMGEIVQAQVTSEFNCFVLWDADSYGKLQFRHSVDGSAWSDWVDFKPTLATFRYLEFRVVLGRGSTSDNPEVTVCTLKVDVPDVNRAGGPVAVAAGGTTISLGHTFWEPPSVVATAIGSGVFAEIIESSVTETQFQVRVRNTAGTDVGGTINWMARGY